MRTSLHIVQRETTPFDHGTTGSSDTTRAAAPAVASTLPSDHLERVYGWGGSSSSVAYVYRPSTIAQIIDLFTLARSTGQKIGLRGAGRSYGDASTSSENIVLDLSRMNRILSWDPDNGVITVEPGVTIRDLWQHVIGDGWWPAVVPGTMFPTIGGCAAMNIHGKNNFAVGPIGDHIAAFELLTPTGERLHCSRSENADIFHHAIGGFGMLGVFTSVTLTLKRIHSGLLDVEAINVGSLSEMFARFEERLPVSDYLVGWIDTFGSGKSLGRGVIHQANYLAEGVDPRPAQTLRVENQQLPDAILGLLPKSMLWHFMKPFMNDVGMRFINLAKYRASRLLDRGNRFRQSHAGFAFLLDYVPDWKKSYGPGGLIQYQSFVPREEAQRVFARQLELCREAGLPSYLAVFKRHRADAFPLSHALDGYSLALDFKVTPAKRKRIWQLAARMNDVVLEAGGRFYFAKDSTLTAENCRLYLGEETLGTLDDLKRRLDPDHLLQTDLSKRLFPW